MNLTPLWMAWAFLAACVVAIMLYRRLLESREDDTVHLADSETPLIERQRALAGRLQAIDRFGRFLGALALLTGLALGAVQIYRAWQSTLVPPA